MKIDKDTPYCHSAVDKILLDGVVVTRVTAIDTDSGELERFKTGKKNEVLCIKNTPCKELLVGTIEVIYNEGWGWSDKHNAFTYKGNPIQ